MTIALQPVVRRPILLENNELPSPLSGSQFNSLLCCYYSSTLFKNIPQAVNMIIVRHCINEKCKLSHPFTLYLIICSPAF